MFIIRRNIKYGYGEIKMRLQDLKETKNQKGTYAGLKFDNESNKTLIKLVNELGIPNPIDINEIHMTLLYSRKYLPNYKPAGNIDEWAYPTKFNVFETFDKKRALVLMVDSPFAEKRHNMLMKEHNATYDYPSYLPHVTLSYDIGELNIPEWKNIPEKLHINVEYYEELNLEWGKS